ncbi:hypothetical protein Y032_0002g858 [Ancylostoma ceylanicum]|nr:hypothetical protein Y032_0002g858 [Ancylostoma ceylanicum]
MPCHSKLWLNKEKDESRPEFDTIQNKGLPAFGKSGIFSNKQKHFHFETLKRKNTPLKHAQRNYFMLNINIMSILCHNSHFRRDTAVVHVTARSLDDTVKITMKRDTQIRDGDVECWQTWPPLDRRPLWRPRRRGFTIYTMFPKIFSNSVVLLQTRVTIINCFVCHSCFLAAINASYQTSAVVLP